MTLNQVALVINNPKFCGLWSYRPHRRLRRYCCTVIIEDQATETHMFDEWTDAVKEAGDMLHREVTLAERTTSAGT